MESKRGAGAWADHPAIYQMTGGRVSPIVWGMGFPGDSTPGMRSWAVHGLAVVALALLLIGLPAKAREALDAGGRARVARVIDGDTVVLADGREVRLVGIQAPKLPLGRPNFRAWPLADDARDALGRLVLGQDVTLGYGGTRVDRHGRQLAHLHAAGTWIQGEMLARGLARVYTFSDNRSLAAELYAIERQAREEMRGMWNNPYYRIRTPETVGRDVGTFQLVEGRVAGAATVKGRTYINFGPDHREDFTIIIPPKSRRSFDMMEPRPEALAGRHVRVRGWIQSLNGPMVEATHPEQIEVLDP